MFSLFIGVEIGVRFEVGVRDEDGVRGEVKAEVFFSSFVVFSIVLWTQSFDVFSDFLF